MSLSALGIFHTLIGVIAILAAIVSFARYGKINLGMLSGKIYFFGTVVTCITALGIYKHGGFNPGHVLTIITLLLVLVAYYLFSQKKGGRPARYFENFLLSFSFFLSMLPTVNETFTRIPVGHPLAKDIKDPLIVRTILIFLFLFVSGSVYQFIRQRKANNAVPHHP